MSGRGLDPPSMKSSAFKVNDLPVLDAPQIRVRLSPNVRAAGALPGPVKVRLRRTIRSDIRVVPADGIGAMKLDPPASNALGDKIFQFRTGSRQYVED